MVGFGAAYGTVIYGIGGFSFLTWEYWVFLLFMPIFYIIGVMDK